MSPQKIKSILNIKPEMLNILDGSSSFSISRELGDKLGENRKKIGTMLFIVGKLKNGG